MAVKFDGRYLESFVKEYEFEAMAPQVKTAHDMLRDKTGPGNDFLGWLDLPQNYDKDEFARIKKTAKKIRGDSDALVVIGIGGSYLGARAAIEFLKSPNYNLLKKDSPDIYFIGNSISSSALDDIIRLCWDKDISVNVISKSGTTTEPAVAFRVFRKLLEKKYGKEGAAKRIYATTDKERFTLKMLADREGYESFVVPDDIGGRYSVLTAVGLLPIAVAGCDIDEIMRGAADAMTATDNPDMAENDCYKYAAARNILYRKGKLIELLTGYEPALGLTAEWFKQLFGESEGKDQKGIFPASAMFSTDLHSLGQYIQDGRRDLFETVINIEKSKTELYIEQEESDADGLNFLAGKPVSFINEKAFLGTVLAHCDGGVPNIVLNIPEMNEYEYGYMTYFFEKACAISGYILGVNPFDQPGVESYKKNMFALLGKPGYEAERDELMKRL